MNNESTALQPGLNSTSRPALQEIVHYLINQSLPSPILSHALQDSNSKGSSKGTIERGDRNRIRCSQFWDNLPTDETEQPATAHCQSREPSKGQKNVNNMQQDKSTDIIHVSKQEVDRPLYSSQRGPLLAASSCRFLNASNCLTAAT